MGVLGLLQRALGLALAAALSYGAWHVYENYGAYANVARWSGEASLGWMRAWLVEFRMPLLCVTGMLALSIISWLWRLLRLGH